MERKGGVEEPSFTRFASLFLLLFFFSRCFLLPLTIDLGGTVARVTVGSIRIARARTLFD